ncbi:MAG: F0F1 ATP synthase subunit alpha [Candidatus Dojkabacteria bacterium]
MVDSVFNNLKQFEFSAEVEEEGEIIEVRDGIARIRGLTRCLNQELLETEHGVRMSAFNLERTTVGAIVLDEYSKVSVGQTVRRTYKVLSIGVSEKALGRVVDPLMRPLDGLDEILLEESMLVDSQAPGVIERSPVDTPLQTGIKVLDALVPIGKGQRELIIGDRQTGKTSLAIDTIINQKGKDVLCIYVSIGQKESKLARITEQLREADCMDYCVFVDASASMPASLQYLAPYSATAIAEYFMKKGRNVLVVYDDLSKHAVAYREISLILNRPPGREAFPGDVFYLHSRLLERSCKLSEEYGGGTITSLPIIETLAGDISAYVPTNVISITDGQIFLESDLFHKGIRPAINPGLSVSRVGGAAQTKAIKKVAGSVKLSLAQFRELEHFSQFSSELDEETLFSLDRGQKIQELLKQKNGEPVMLADQVLTFYAVNNGVFDEVELSQVRKVLGSFLTFARIENEELVETLDNGTWSDEIEAALKALKEKFVERS